MNAVAEEVKLLKLDLGCGPNKREGFIGVDSRQFDGKVDQVVDVAKLKSIRPITERNEALDEYRPTVYGVSCYEPWPWADNSVEEIHCSHMLEHLRPTERVHFANEAYRILIPGGKVSIITPHAFAERAYGDLTHQWPPVTGFWTFYLDKGWRAGNAPHNDFYTCDFACTWGYSMHPGILAKNAEYQQHALCFFKEAAQDMILTMTARK